MLHKSFLNKQRNKGVIVIIGYELDAQYDNDSYMFDPIDPNLPTCQKCGYVTNFDYISPLFKLNKQCYDISYTYDLRLIVSLKFKEFCARNHYKDIGFSGLPNDPNFFRLDVKNIINFDTKKAKLQYYKYCDICHNYDSVTPAHPICLKDVNKPLEDGFYATDVHFASGNEKCPTIIIGVKTYEKMKKEKFKGIVFVKIEL